MKKSLLLFILLFAALSGKAQLVYGNDALKFNGTATTWNGRYYLWTDYGAGYLRMNLMPNFPYLTSGTMSILFADVKRNNKFIKLLARDFYSVSDMALKTNIAPLGNAMKTTLALRPVTYRWKDQTEYLNKSTSPLATNPKELGFIAQEVERVLPDIVATHDDGQKLINYSAIIPVLTAAIQELNAHIEALEQQLNSK